MSDFEPRSPDTNSVSSRIKVEYPPETMDEIRQYALHGLMRLRTMTNGGVELGGVLFGARIDNGLTIQAWRPIECARSSGPGFQLFEKDRVSLQRQLEEAQSNPDLNGLQAVGWFVSHARTAIGLTPGDVAIFDRFFPEQWQITLLLQPFRESATKAAFYAREADGSLRSGPSVFEFVIEPLSVGTLPAKVVERMQVLEPRRTKLPDFPSLAGLTDSTSKPTKSKALQPKAPQPPLTGPRAKNGTPPEPDLFTTQQNLAVEGRQIWVWSFMGLFLLAVAVVLAWKLSKPSPSIAFHVVDSGGQILLQWDRNAAAIQKSARGTLDIKDGNSSSQFPLDAAGLRQGNFRYTRKSGDQDVVMNVYPADGPAIRESARFVGLPPATAAPDEIAHLRKERDDLTSEVTHLREQLKSETSRREKLEEQLGISQKRAQSAKPRARKRKSTRK